MSELLRPRCSLPSNGALGGQVQAYFVGADGVIYALPLVCVLYGRTEWTKRLMDEAAGTALNWRREVREDYDFHAGYQLNDEDDPWAGRKAPDRHL